MPLKHKSSKFHQKLKLNGLDLVDFGVLEIWWQKITFRSGLWIKIVISGKGKAIVLISASPLDENTLENPKKVYSKTEDMKLAGAGCKRTFPGNSLTVIRFGTK